MTFYRTTRFTLQWSTSYYGWIGSNEGILSDSKTYHSEPVLVDKLNKDKLWELFLEGERSLQRREDELSRNKDEAGEQ